jgi:hypothetical protein
MLQTSEHEARNLRLAVVQQQSNLAQTQNSNRFPRSQVRTKIGSHFMSHRKAGITHLNDND